MTNTHIRTTNLSKFTWGKYAYEKVHFLLKTQQKNPAMFAVCNYTNLLHSFICTATNLCSTDWFNPLAQYLSIKQIIK